MRDYGVHVFAENSKSIEQLLKKFKKRVKKAGILEEYRDKQYYEKPSATKRRKKQLARYHALSK